MENSLKTFPENSTDALTMLYLERQDLTGKTPEELVELYWETHCRVKNATKEIRAKETKKWLT